MHVVSMQFTKQVFVRYIELFSICAAILNVVKFTLERDIGGLRTIAVIAAVTFTLFAVYLTFLVSRVKID